MIPFGTRHCLLDPVLGLDMGRIDLCPHSIRSWHPLWYFGYLPAHRVPFMALWESTEFELGNQHPVPQFPLPNPKKKEGV